MYQYKATTLKIVDGDTVDVLLELGFGVSLKQRVRLTGLDAAERFTDAGKTATAALKLLMPVGAKIVLTSTKPAPKDKYGRYLAEIVIGGTNVNKYLIDNLLAKSI